MKKPRKTMYRSSSPDLASGKSRLVSMCRNPEAYIARKKQRLVVALSDDENEQDEATTSFSQRLTRFKKSPAKKKGVSLFCLFSSSVHLDLLSAQKSQSASSDDDDFIVPSDSDVETKSVKSSSSRSSASRHAAASSDELSGDTSDGERKQIMSKARPSAKKGASKSKSKVGEGASATGSFAFLTAAEQREQDKKNDKKAAEDPYAFLAEIRDASPCRVQIPWRRR